MTMILRVVVIGVMMAMMMAMVTTATQHCVWTMMVLTIVDGGG